MTDKEIIEAEEKRKAEFKGKNVVFMDRPLIQHKISILRNETTGTNEFRRDSSFGRIRSLERFTFGIRGDEDSNNHNFDSLYSWKEALPCTYP